MPQRINQAAQQAQQSLQRIQQVAQQLAGQGQQTGSFAGSQGMMQAGGFTGAQSVMQPGFAGTDAQQVRQDIANSLNRGNMGGYTTQQAGGFTGAQSVMQPGFAGTDAQQVRQDIANSLMRGNQGGYTQQAAGFMPQTGSFAGSQGMMQAGGFAGAQSVMQPGFAGTDAQQVRQDIANSLMRGNQGGYTQQAAGFMPQTGSFAGSQGMMQAGGFAGAQSVMQPGFAGTDAQQVRQDIANSLMRGNQGGYTQQAAGFMPQTGSFAGSQGMMQAGGFAGAQSVMQPGFAGTDAQQVRQDISNDLMRGNQGGYTQQAAGFMPQTGSSAGSQGMMQAGGFAGAQSVMQPGFAGTDAQQVRQDIASDMNRGSQAGFFQ